MPTFNELPAQLQMAITYRAELEHFGWGDEAFIAYGCALTNIPLEAAHVTPPNSTLVTVHLKLPDRPAGDEFVIVAGYLDDETWPAESSLKTAMAAWNELSQDDRNEVRKKFVTENDAKNLIGALIARGMIPPKFAEAHPEMAAKLRQGGN